MQAITLANRPTTTARRTTRIRGRRVRRGLLCHRVQVRDRAAAARQHRDDRDDGDRGHERAPRAVGEGNEHRGGHRGDAERGDEPPARELRDWAVRRRAPVGARDRIGCVTSLRERRRLDSRGVSVGVARQNVASDRDVIADVDARARQLRSGIGGSLADREAPALAELAPATLLDLAGTLDLDRRRRDLDAAPVDGELEAAAITARLGRRRRFPIVHVFGALPRIAVTVPFNSIRSSATRSHNRTP